MHRLLTATALCLVLAAPAVARGVEKPIQFKPNTTQAEVKGSVVRGDRDLYTLVARKGQRMHVHITSLEKNAVMQIYAPGWKKAKQGAITGKTLRGAGETDDATAFAGTLPANGTYLFVVGGTRGNATYTLSLRVK